MRLKFPRLAISLAAAIRPCLLGAGGLVFALLAACSQDGPPPLPPLPEGALEAVAIEPGVPREALARAADALFTQEGMGETHALIIMHGGEIVAERYADEFAAETRFSGGSMSKTVTGVIIGMMVAEGRIALDDSPPVTHWQRAREPRGEITLRQLLQMRSGLRHSEVADPVLDSSALRMMYLDGRDNMAAWAEAQPLDHPPGQQFTFSTATSVILSDIAARLLVTDGGPSDRQEAVSQYLEARLAVPLGMKTLVAQYDAAGTMAGGSDIWASARDWAKFGEFLRHGGSVRGVQVVPRGWVDFMRSESPRAPDYGAHLWLNRASGVEGRDMLFADKGPASLFAAVGEAGQYLLVSPDQKLTIVRLGKTGDADIPALKDGLAQLVALYPQR